MCTGNQASSRLADQVTSCVLCLQGSSGSQVVAGGFRFYKLGTFAWLAIAVSCLFYWLMQPGPAWNVMRSFAPALQAAVNLQVWRSITQ